MIYKNPHKLPLHKKNNINIKDEQIIQWMCLIKHGFIIQLKNPEPVIHMLTDHE